MGNYSMNIIVIRLITSEEIIAEVRPEKNANAMFGKLKLINPAAIITRQDPGGQPKMGLADCVPMADAKEVLINENVILFTYKPVVELINAYNKAFGSGLIVSGAKFTT